MKSFLCLTLSVLLLIACLAGCGSSDGAVTQTEAPAAAGAESVTFVFSQSEDIQSTKGRLQADFLLGRKLCGFAH